MNFLDLFHGIGGFAIGAYLAGMRFDNHFCSDIEPYCVKLYAKRFPDSIQLGDITKIDFESLKKDYHGKWIITGGFPCQDISIAGKGAGIEGKRSGLWFEYWRAIRILRPKVAIIENVSAITFRGLNAVLSSLAEIGYDAEWQDIRAEDMGAPHRRERIWIVSYPSSFRCNQSEYESQKNGQFKTTQKRGVFKFSGKITEVSNSFKQHDDNTGYGTGKIRRERSKQTEIQRSLADSNAERLQTQRIKKWIPEKKRETCSGIKRASVLWQEWYTTWWESEPAVGRVAHGIPNRVDRLKGLGNSIVPQIAEILFRLIKDLI